jgi:hypothetical protein
LEDISEFSSPSIHPSNQRCLIYSFTGCRVQVKVKQVLEKADCIAVISDGWSNVRGQGIINYISTPQPVFYKSTDTQGARCTDLYIDDCLQLICNDLVPQKAFELVTDNAANMKAAWSKVVSYPPITPIDFAAHALNLLLKGIMTLNTMDTLYKRANHIDAAQQHTLGWCCNHV